MRIGHGYDVHRLVAGRKLILGGVEVPHSLGLLGHSDADVLLHAIMDALLGAAALGKLAASHVCVVGLGGVGSWTVEALARCERTHTTDWSAIKGEIKSDLSGFLYKKTKRNPMILPVIMEV